MGSNMRMQAMAFVLGALVIGQSLVGPPAEARPDTKVEVKKSAGDRLDSANFDKFLAMIKPRPGEAPWAEIPWIADLYEARKKAAAEGKPLFVWSASGESLGCT
jgi:hypothetical protein